MKKLALALILILCFSTASFAIRAGNFGVTASSMMQREVLPWSNYAPGTYPLGTAYAGIFYNFTDVLCGELGLSWKNEVTQYDDNNVRTAIRLAGWWNLGRGNAIPRLGAELNWKQSDWSYYDNAFKYLTLAVLFGAEIQMLDNVTATLDVKLLETFGEEFENAANYVYLFPGYSFGLKWYII